MGPRRYGNWIGPIKTPSREDDPLAMRPMFYYDMEEWCQVPSISSRSSPLPRRLCLLVGEQTRWRSLPAPSSVRNQLRLCWGC